MGVGCHALGVLIAVLGVPVGRAQFSPSGYPVAIQDESDSRSESARRLQWEAAYEARRARAHARLGIAASSIEPQALCPAFDGPKPSAWVGDAPNTNAKFAIRPFVARSALRPGEVGWRGVAPPGESASGLFREFISEPVVQAKCINCHVEGGVSSHTRLVLSPSTVAGHQELNLAVFEELIATDDDVADLILNKIQGVGHGGGIQVPAGSADFANMERFLRLLGGETSSARLSPETLFEGVTMASPAKTLRRAALMFAGRLPTQAELNAVNDGDLSSLRRAIRSLMAGQGFHEFLVRASNDRLLTDRHYSKVIDNDQEEFVELTKTQWTKAKAAIGKGFEEKWNDPAYYQWAAALQHGFVRAPLELIAYVVENDLPYTEVLTADYIMANPMAAAAYGATTQFDNAADPLEFRPSEIVSYYRNDDSKMVERVRELGRLVTNPGNLATDYPHAGILNTTVYLRRYPTTDTNRNRARSRWTYYYFLGLDIEKSAARTTDPAALADTDNPTMNNPACTVCHSVLDPVAGAFQNYGDLGLYRHKPGGLDSLPDLYKFPEDGSASPYRTGDSWFRDMRMPGFGDALAPSADNSLQWLAERIVEDDRFAEAAVKFWWPSILGVEVVSPPEDGTDPDFQGRLLASTAQANEVRRLAEAFRTGIAGGQPYNAKDLLAEIALSPWFRAASLAGQDPIRDAALREAGIERLLTPEELNRKTEAVSGIVWGRQYHRMTSSARYTFSRLTAPTSAGDYGLLYGGIDSDGITKRTGDMTPLMAAVAQSHAAEVSCPIVRREFFFWPEEKRLLFDGIKKSDTPVSDTTAEFAVTADSWQSRQTLSLVLPLDAGRKTVGLTFTNPFYDEATDEDRGVNLDRLVVRDRSGKAVREVEVESLGRQECGSPRSQFYRMWCERSLQVPVGVLPEGEYTIDVMVHQNKLGDEAARLLIVVESHDGTSRGAAAIRNKLVELHDKLLGVTVSADSPDVDTAFRLFKEVWESKRSSAGPGFEDMGFGCRRNEDQLYYDGLAEDVLVHDENGGLEWDWDRLDEFYREVGEMQDPHHTVRAWVVTLAYFLMDYRYLYF